MKSEIIDDKPPSSGKNDKPLGRNVILLGITSFFTDISSEMIYPLVQAFVSLVLKSAGSLIAPVLGIIEGIAEATASLLKVYAGLISDRMKVRKPMTISGYSLSALSKLIYLLAGFGWGFILLSRFMDRIGKGIRTAPRDALIAESVGGGLRGKAFGYHRAMDYAGAFLGVLICYFISSKLVDPREGTIVDIQGFYQLFLISLIPAFLGVAALLFIREKTYKADPQDKPVVPLSFRLLDGRLKLFFISVFLFTLGNSSNQFLLMRSMDMGVSLPDVLLMYMVFNLVTSLLSTPLGGVSDRIGRKRVILAGYLLYSLIYFLFGLMPGRPYYLLWFFWAGYGMYYALTEGVEKALVSELAPEDRRATALGLFSAVTGITLLPASLIAGFLYSFAGKAYPFYFGSLMSLLAVVIMGLFLKESRPGGTADRGIVNS